MERRQEIRDSHPDIPFAEVTKILGQEWSSMVIDKKQVLLRLHAGVVGHGHMQETGITAVTHRAWGNFL
jgi:hypothetical protein